MGFDFSIEYKKGKENIVADALSRRDEKLKDAQAVQSTFAATEEKGVAELIALSSPIPNWLEVIKDEVGKSPELQELVKKIKEEEVLGPWQYKEGLLFFKDRIFLSENSALITAILEQLHGGFHEGYHKTFQRIRANFYWKGMSRVESKSSSRNVRSANATKLRVLLQEDYYNPSLYRKKYGRIFLWILLTACLVHGANRLFLW
jgi:hypothetical protein